MFSFIKRSLCALADMTRRARPPAELAKERWAADFSSAESSCFIIKPEMSPNAKLENGSLVLGSPDGRPACAEAESPAFGDQIIEARFRLNGAGCCAAGIMFRISEGGARYLALVSGEGRFRLDAAGGNSRKTLVDWIDAPEARAEGEGARAIALGILAHGSQLVFTVNGKWVAEASDDSSAGGRLGFAFVPDARKSAGGPPEAETRAAQSGGCEARLEHLSVNAAQSAIEKELGRWNDGAEISAESRMRLAETLAASGLFEAAHSQVLRIWMQRENAARSVTATPIDARSKKELLFAARMALRLDLHETAEEYINACICAGTNDADESEILEEKARIMNARGRHAELAGFLPECILKFKKEKTPKTPERLRQMHALLGIAQSSLQNHEAAADAWGKASALDKTSGACLEGLADACNALGRSGEALQNYLKGGSCYLRDSDFEKLGGLVEKMLEIGRGSRKAHELAAKWALGAGDLDRAKLERGLAKQAGKTRGDAASDAAEAPQDKGGAKSAKAKKSATEKESAQTNGKAVRANAQPEDVAKPAKSRKGATEKEPVQTKPKAARANANPEDVEKSAKGRKGAAEKEPAQTNGKAARAKAHPEGVEKSAKDRKGTAEKEPAQINGKAARAKAHPEGVEKLAKGRKGAMEKKPAQTKGKAASAKVHPEDVAKPAKSRKGAMEKEPAQAKGKATRANANPEDVEKPVKGGKDSTKKEPVQAKSKVVRANAQPEGEEKSAKAKKGAVAQAQKESAKAGKKAAGAKSEGKKGAQKSAKD